MPEFRGVGFEQAVLASRPLRPQDYDDERRKMWNDAIARGLPVPPVYPGHILKPCHTCQIPVVVGPNQQEALEEHPETLIFCLIDAVLYVAETHSDESEIGVVNLGNEYKEK